MKIQFTKMHGLGNDFVILDNRRGRIKNLKKLAVKLCDRRFGIGADQLIILGNSRRADFKMGIINADGSEVEMCGNGIRCLAKYIWDNRIRSQKAGTRSQELRIETLAGIIIPEKTGTQIKVDMGEPVLEPAMIPVSIKIKQNSPATFKSQLSTLNSSALINYPLTINGKVLKFTCVSMGNPHAVIVVRNVERALVDTIGPALEKHRIFPNRTNVEFIQIVNKKNIAMRVWERGAGETLACGTGASAAAVASSLLRLTDRSVTMHLLGGKLRISWDKKNNHVYMTGPAVKVFEGTIEA